MGSLATATAPASSALPIAVCAGRVELRYDVLSDVGTGRLVGLQADLVWEHPAWGALPADDVWAAAARQGRHRALRRWLLDRACRDVAALSDTVSVGVRLPAELTDAGSLFDDVTDARTATGLAADRLTLAFPEDLLPGAAADLPAALRALHDSGVRLALTDYGLGTTLCGLLTRAPLDAVVVSVRALGLLAMTGPLLPSSLSAAQVTALPGS